MILEVRHLSVAFRHGRLRRQLVHDVCFTLERDQCLGILGESGSGKSITCAAINGLLDERFIVEGEVFFQGRDLLRLSAEERRRLRGSAICMIMQSPMTAFNPLFTVGNQLVESVAGHRRQSVPEILAMLSRACGELGLAEPERIFCKYPHELSGGMLQRLMIALTIVLEPALIIADEPTTAIDYVHKQEALVELQNMQKRHRTALIFISHDLSLVAHLADTALVMHQGQVVEQGNCREIFARPRSPHTAYLLETRLKLVDNFHHVLQDRYAA